MELNINGETVGVKLAAPNQSQVFELDKFYRRIFSECLREGILTEAEAKKRFEETGAWSKEDDDKVTNLIKTIAFNSVLLKEEDGLTDDAAELVTKIQADRNTMLEMLARKTELFSNTAEAMANEQKVYKFVLLCLVDESGHQVFSGDADLEAYSASDSEGFDKLMKNAYSHVYDVDIDNTDLTEDWAELEFLRNLAENEELKSSEETNEEPSDTSEE